MHEVVAQRLWIGNARDARTPQALFESGIAAVVDLAYEESIAVLPREIVYCRFPLTDGSGNDAHLLQLAVDTVVKLLAGETPTLVACGAGMSRSPAVAAAALSIHVGEPADRSLSRIAEVRPHDVSPVLWRELLEARKSH
jgi:protein-tyrosine phosphatase